MRCLAFPLCVSILYAAHIDVYEGWPREQWRERDGRAAFVPAVSYKAQEREKEIERDGTRTDDFLSRG